MQVNLGAGPLGLLMEEKFETHEERRSHSPLIVTACGTDRRLNVSVLGGGTYLISTSVWTSVAFPVLASLSGLLNTSSPHCTCSTQTSGPVEAMSLGRRLRWNMGWGAALASGQASRLLSSLTPLAREGFIWREETSLEVVGTCPSRLTSLLQTRDLC